MFLDGAKRNLKMENKIRPIRRFVLVLDDPPDHVECGVVVLHGISRRANLDYVVVRVGEDENVDFGQGDRVILSSPDVGRPVRIDGIYYRLVRVSDVIAVIS